MRAALRESSALLVAGAFGGGFGLGHSFAHFGLDRVEVETGTALHRWVIKEGLNFFADDLLDEHETPEFILEPIEVLLGTDLLAPLSGQPARSNGSRRRLVMYGTSG